MADPGTVRSPFQPQPISPRDPAAPHRGCSKPALVGCGLLLVLLGLGAILFIVNAQGITAWWLRLLEKQVQTQLPPDATAQDRERLRAAFADVRRALETQKIDAAALQQVQTRVLQIAKKTGQVSRQDILDLTAALERLAGKSPPPQPSPPAETPAPRPGSGGGVA